MRRGAILVLVALAGVALVSSASPVFAYDFNVKAYVGYSQYDGWSGAQGGEFKIVTHNVTLGSNTTDWDGYYQPVASKYGYSDAAGFDFPTFCVQKGETFSPGTPYGVFLRDTTNLGVPLDPGAAALYAKWYKMQLNGYNYANSGNGRYSDATYLQRLIWWRMGQVGSPGMTRQQLGLPADAKYDQWYGIATTSSGSTQGVKVMQLGVNGGNQDMLVLTMGNGTPLIPEPGSLALLAIGALGVLPLLRRRTTT
jgi:hypothetical protein